MTTRVGVVEDDLILAEQFLRTLDKAGLEARHAGHAIDAIDMIDSFKPDVLVIDMLLAGTTALTLVHELQSHHDLSKIPIILVTSATELIEPSKLSPYGVKRVLDKTTMHPDDIVYAVRSVSA